MARLALSLLGGIIGGLLALPTGGISVGLGFSIGSSIGGIVGQLAFPGKGTHVYGPRVNDMQVSSSAPGSNIPLLFGSMRLGGQIIWSTGLTEHTHTTSQSAKGMPSVTQTTYTYTTGFAAAYCQGPAKITRIWADSKLIYDKSGKSNPNKGTWSSSVSYNVNDVVKYTDKKFYICMVANENQLPTNTAYWALDLAETNVNTSKYDPPTFYEGTETQLADPTIIAHEGINNTPAYRGTCYSVWEKLLLTDFGNRLPNIRAEVTSNGIPAFPMTRQPWEFSNSVQPNYTVTDQNQQTAWVWQGATLNNAAVAYIMRVDLTTNEVVATGLIDASTIDGWVPDSDMIPGFGGVMTVDNDGYLWGKGQLGGHIGVFKLDPWTFKALAFFDMFDASVSQQLDAITTAVAPDGSSFIVGLGHVSYASSFSSTGYAAFVIRSSDATIVGQYYDFNPPLETGDISTAPNFRQTYPVVDSVGNIYFIYSAIRFPGVAGQTELGDWFIKRINTSAGASDFVTPAPAFLSANTYHYGIDSDMGIGRVLYVNPSDNSLTVMTNGGAWLKIDPNNGDILDRVGGNSDRQFLVSSATTWQKQVIAGSFLNYETGDGGSGCMVQQAFRGRVRNSQLWAPALDNEKVLVVSPSDFSTVAEYDMGDFPDAPGAPDSNWPLTSAGAGTYVYDTPGNSLLALSAAQARGYPTTFPTAFAYYRAYLDRLSTNGLTADAIVHRLCVLSGVDEANIDTAQLSGIHVQGYPITSLGATKDFINVLGQTYFFEGRESDFKLQFVPRGQPAVANILTDDLGLIADKGAVEEKIGQEQDLPKTVEVIYIDPNQDYQQGQQRRIRYGATTTSQNQTSISLPIVLTSVQAAQLADKIMWTAENERRTYKTNLWKAYHMLLDACDVITFEYQGLLFTARLANNMNGQNYATSFDLTNEDSNTYQSVATGVNNAGFVGQVIKGLALSLLWILDIPYLRDQDADAAGNIGYYFAMTPASAGGSWPAGVLYQSSDNAAFTNVDASATPAQYGVAQNVLPEPVTGTFAWDRVSTLTVRMAIGDNPLSDTELNVLNGTNAAILYPSLEVIQFSDVTDNGNGTVTLSNLLRGRRGTDDFVGDHVPGEIVIFLLNGGVVHEQVSLSQINLQRYYRGITVGADLNSNPITQRVALKGRDLMPYAPAAFYNEPSGSDILFTWFRRTRLGGALIDGTGQVPLAEDNESYDITILDGGGVLKRTFSNIQPPGGVPDSWTSPAQPHQLYTAGQQATDGYAPGTGWTAVCYQLSGQVQRGFPTVNDLP